MARARKQQRVHVEKHNIGDVKYEVIVDVEGGHYYGRWVCVNNGQTGSSSAQCSSVREAVQAGKMNLGTYHFHTFPAATEGH